MLYNQAVRRFLAIVLAVLVGLPVVSPLFALSSGGDPTRPTCCRRNGKHRCMSMDMDASPSAASASPGTRLSSATVSERCPYGSKTVPGRTHPDWTLDAAAAIYCGIVSHPSVAPQTESKRRISADRSRQKRGPPSENT